MNDLKELKVNKMYTWKSIDEPCYVLEKSKAIDMYTVELEDGEQHFIDIGNIIELTPEHQDLDWCRLLSDT